MLPARVPKPPRELACGASTPAACSGAMVAPASSVPAGGERIRLEAKFEWRRRATTVADVAPLEPSCRGALTFDSRKKESWLTRNSANKPKAQLMPMIEAKTATIIRRTFGNIRPRRTPRAIRQPPRPSSA